MHRCKTYFVVKYIFNKYTYNVILVKYVKYKNGSKIMIKL